MSMSDEEETAPLISATGTPTVVGNSRQLRKKQLAVNIILTSVLLERTAFYTLAANIALNLETDKLQWSPTNGLITSLLFSGTSSISSIIFAILGDAKLGRAKTIVVGFGLYLIGYILSIGVIVGKIGKDTNGACESTGNSHTIFHERCAPWILPILIVIAMGAGAVQSNMAVFGAEQIPESRLTTRFFDKYVVAVNIGAAIAISATPFTLSDDRSYYIIYMATASALFVGALIFIIGWRYYIHIQPYDSVVINCFPVFRNAFQSWRESRGNSYPTVQRESTSTSALHNLNEADGSVTINEHPHTFLDFAKLTNHGRFPDHIVDDVKSLRKALIIFSLLVPYWLIYHQVNSMFRIQSEPNETSKGPAQRTFFFVSLADSITIIMGILILNMYVYKCRDTHNRVSVIMIKFIIGMCFACLTMLTAGASEKIQYESRNQTHNDSNSAVYYQLPQNILMGISEIFGMLASFEYAYFAAPRSAQTLFMSLRFCSVGVASFIGAAYISVFPSPSSKSDESPVYGNHSDLYIYFFSLAGLQIIFIVIFIVCQNKYGIIKLNAQQMQADHPP